MGIKRLHWSNVCCRKRITFQWNIWIIFNSNITIINEDHLHQLARLFMSQFSFKQLSLDEYLLEYNEELTDDERNLGYYILALFDE